MKSTDKPGHITRFVSRLTRDTIALILAGGRGSRLKHLTQWRAKPAMPFGGKFRIIDFPLSNCINSDIRRIAVLTQYKSHSLIRHIQQGWNFLRGELGEFIEVVPAQQRIATSWYTGTADAVFQNLDIIRNYGVSYVLILAGDHIYKMDYGPMLASHVEAKADMTIACIETPIERARAFGVMSVDANWMVKDFQEKPESPQPLPGNKDKALVSMGIYVFNTLFLFEQLVKDADISSSSHDFGKDIIPSAIRKYRVHAYPFKDPVTGDQAYWRDVGTVDAFWEANMELIGVTPELNMYDEDWPIWTYQAQLPPAKFVFDDEGGLLERESRELNPGFVSRMTRGRPWVTVKLAASLDGGTALPGGESHWITGEAAREDVQRLRARSSAVMTGSGTVIADDPRLDVRLPGATRQPLRVVLDSRLRTPPGARILAPPGRALVLCAESDAARAAALEAAGAEVAAVGGAEGRVDLEAALALLASRGINELLVECGAGLAGALFATGLVDELALYLAPTLLGRGARPLADLEAPASMAERLEFAIVGREDVGGDLLLRLRPRRGAA